MVASPEARRAILLGAGQGLRLACIEWASSWGWAGGLVAIALGLVPVALALAIGGPLVAVLTGGGAMIAMGIVRGGRARGAGDAHPRPQVPRARRGPRFRARPAAVSRRHDPPHRLREPGRG